MLDKIVERVREKLLKRSEVGIKKYGDTIWENTDENYMKHLQEELLDGANYCEQVMRLGDFTTKVVKTIEAEPNDVILGAVVRALYQQLKKEE